MLLAIAFIVVACGENGKSGGQIKLDNRLTLQLMDQQRSTAKMLAIAIERGEKFLEIDRECRTSGPSMFSTYCDSYVRLWEEFRDERNNRVSKLALAGDEDAIDFAWEKEILPRDKLQVSIVDKAEVSANPRLLLIASRIYQDGRYRQRDVDRAAGFLAKSWALGEPQAAGELTLLMYSINDYRSAYLWRLRCIGDCAQSGNIPSVSNLEGRMTAAAIKQVLALSKDPTVIEVPSE